MLRFTVATGACVDCFYRNRIRWVFYWHADRDFWLMWSEESKPSLCVSVFFCGGSHKEATNTVSSKESFESLSVCSLILSEPCFKATDSLFLESCNEV